MGTGVCVCVNLCWATHKKKKMSTDSFPPPHVLYVFSFVATAASCHVLSRLLGLVHNSTPLYCESGERWPLYPLMVVGNALSSCLLCWHAYTSLAAAPTVGMASTVLEGFGAMAAAIGFLLMALITHPMSRRAHDWATYVALGGGAVWLVAADCRAFATSGISRIWARVLCIVAIGIGARLFLDNYGTGMELVFERDEKLRQLTSERDKVDMRSFYSGGIKERLRRGAFAQYLLLAAWVLHVFLL